MDIGSRYHGGTQTPRWKLPVVGPEFPSQPGLGEVVYQTTDNHGYIWNGSAWLIIEAVLPGAQAILSDGTIPLIADWQAGAFTILAYQFNSQIPDGDPPLIVTSTTTVTNLSADTVDNIDGSSFVRNDDGTPNTITGFVGPKLTLKADLAIDGDQPSFLFVTRDHNDVGTGYWSSDGSILITDETWNKSIKGVNDLLGILSVSSSGGLVGGVSIQDTEDVGGYVKLGFNSLYVDGTTRRVGLGTAAPDRKLEVVDPANPQARLTHTSDSTYTDLKTTSSGFLQVNPIGGVGGRIGLNVDPARTLDVSALTGQTSIRALATAHVNGPFLDLTNETATLASGGTAGSIHFDAKTSTPGSTVTYSSITGVADNITTGALGGSIRIEGRLNNATTTWMTLTGASMRILQASGGKVFIGPASTNAFMTTGLTIDQGGADDSALAFKSSDVAHGMTVVADTNTYGAFGKIVPTGGLGLAGFSTVTTGLQVTGAHTTDTTLKSTTGAGAVIIAGLLKSGSTVGNLGANANILAIRNNVTTTHLFDSGGNEWMTGGLTVGDSKTVGNAGGSSVLTFSTTALTLNNNFTASKNQAAATSIIVENTNLNVGALAEVVARTSSVGSTNIMRMVAAGYAYPVGDFGVFSRNTSALLADGSVQEAMAIATTSPVIRFYVAGTSTAQERVRIDTNGVGIGTTSIAEKLHLAAAGAVGFKIHNNSATVGDTTIKWGKQATTQYTMGVDDSDNDNFKLTLGSTLGAANQDVLIVNTTIVDGFSSLQSKGSVSLFYDIDGDNPGAGNNRIHFSRGYAGGASGAGTVIAEFSSEGADISALNYLSLLPETYLSFDTVSTNPTITPGIGAQVYMKGTKLIFRSIDGVTVRYKYLDLAGTGVTWVHTTTPP